MNRHPNLLLAVAGALSLSFLAASLALQIFYADPPCMLCNIQRSCVFLSLLVCLSGLFFTSKKQFLSIVIAIYFVNAFFALYHLGIQLGAFQDLCYVPRINDIQQFKQMLKSTVGCSKIGFTIFKLPASAINAIASFVTSMSLAFISYKQTGNELLKGKI